MKNKIILATFLALTLIPSATAQIFDLKFNIVNSTETNLDVQVQIKSSSEFRIAASNIAFDYNPSAINNPVLLTAQNYCGAGGSPLHIYSDMTVTQPDNGITSVNIVYTQNSDEYASEVETNWTNVVTIRYNVIEGNNSPNLVFRSSGISPTLIYKIDGSHLSLLSAGVLGTYNEQLPVELTSFTASVIKNSVMLKWKTATELNNYGYSVERRAKNEEWETIGFVKGNGNSSSPSKYTFKDEKLKPENYQYRLKQIDNDGLFNYSKVIEVVIENIPVQFALEQNYPNPFNPVTKIKYSIPYEGASLMRFVQLKLYDILGREVATLVNEEKSPGVNEVLFNAAELSSGLYIYRLTYNGQVISKKMNLLK